MTDQPLTERQCVICQKREYERAQVCTPCRTSLPCILADIVRLHAQLPEVLQPAQSGAPRVSGSHEAPVPVSLDVVDLAGMARNASPTPQAREHSEDQIGHIAVASILDQWCRDWRDETAFAQSLPAPTVPELARWLSNRCDWACDRHPAVDEFAAEMVSLRGLLRAVLGLTEPEVELMGAPCPGCDMLTLVREPGDDDVECSNRDCLRVLRADEYIRWSRLVLAGEGQLAA